MVLNKDTPVGINSGQGEGSAITSEVLLYRCVIVEQSWMHLMLIFTHGEMQEII